MDEGNVLILTDMEIAVLLDMLIRQDAETEQGKVALTRVWRKLLKLWGVDPTAPLPVDV